MKRILPTHPTDDLGHPIHGALKNPTKQNKIDAARAKMTKHLQLNPEQSYLFCFHGSYVGANGVLRLMFCRYCNEDANA